jgi:hypothetical protein
MNFHIDFIYITFQMSKIRQCEVRSNPLHAKSHIVRDCFVPYNDVFLSC